MLRHVAMFKWKDGVEDEKKVAARDALAALKQQVPSVVEYTFGTLVYGGVMDRYPDLKLCLGHAGGYTAFGVARMDKGWQADALYRICEHLSSQVCVEDPVAGP